MVYVENGGNALKVLAQGPATDGTFYTSRDGTYINETNVPDGTYTLKLYTLQQSPVLQGLNSPCGMAFDASCNIYTADTNQNSLEVLTVADIDSTEVVVDDVAPPVSCTTGATPVNGWYSVSVPVTLAATDSGGSGVGSIQYSLDNVNWNAYTTPFTVSSEGTTTVYWNCTDMGELGSGQPIS